MCLFWVEDFEQHLLNPNIIRLNDSVKKKKLNQLVDQ